MMLSRRVGSLLQRPRISASCCGKVMWPKGASMWLALRNMILRVGPMTTCSPLVLVTSTDTSWTPLRKRVVSTTAAKPGAALLGKPGLRRVTSGRLRP